MRRIGLLVGREWSFPPAFFEEVNRRNAGVVAEYVSVGAVGMSAPCRYPVIIDRISHEVPFYRSFLKQAVLQGTYVVNNPFMWTADDKFFGAALITKLGVASPKTFALPNKSYVPGIILNESLRNLRYPLDWEGLAREVGMPCILKDAHGGGWRDVHVCRSIDELIRAVRSVGAAHDGRAGIHRLGALRPLHVHRPGGDPLMKYDPRERRYLVDPGWLGAELEARIVRDARTIVRALGYDMNSIEFAIRDGVPYAIDFMNPAPDMDINSLIGPILPVGRIAHGRYGDSPGDRRAGRTRRARVAGCVLGKPAVTDDVGAYLDLLTDDVAAASHAMLEDQLRRRGLFFGDRALCTVLRPRLFLPDEYERLERLTAGLMRAFAAAYSAAAVRPDLRRMLRLSDWEEQLFAADPGFPRSESAFASRPVSRRQRRRRADRIQRGDACRRAASRTRSRTRFSIFR